MRRRELIKKKARNFVIQSIAKIVLISIIIMAMGIGAWMVFWKMTNFDILYFICGYIPVLLIIYSGLISIVSNSIHKERIRVEKQIKILSR